MNRSSKPGIGRQAQHRDLRPDPPDQVVLKVDRRIVQRFRAARALADVAGNRSAAFQRIIPMTLKTSAVVLGTISGLAGDQPGRGASGRRGARARHGDRFSRSLLTVKTREGDTDAIGLADGWKISGVAKADRRGNQARRFPRHRLRFEGGWRQRRAGSGDLPGGTQRHRRRRPSMGPSAQQPDDQRHRRRCHEIRGRTR